MTSVLYEYSLQYSELLRMLILIKEQCYNWNYLFREQMNFGGHLCVISKEQNAFMKVLIVLWFNHNIVRDIFGKIVLTK